MKAHLEVWLYSVCLVGVASVPMISCCDTTAQLCIFMLKVTPDTHFIKSQIAIILENKIQMILILILQFLKILFLGSRSYKNA